MGENNDSPTQAAPAKNMDITKMDARDLKALAYDLISQIEVTQRALNNVNQEIAKRANPLANLKIK